MMKNKALPVVLTQYTPSSATNTKRLPCRFVSQCLLSVGLMIALVGCATVPEGETQDPAIVWGSGTPSAPVAISHDPRDPYENWNRSVQSFNDALDDHFMKPIAKVYQHITPEFVDKGVSNFFSNVEDIAVLLNDLLQLKFSQGGMDTGRFLLNSTAGLGGFVDVASMLDLPKHNEDFDQTLGAWGVPSGPYIVLPLVGPSTPRGVGGLVADTAANPFTYVGGAAISSGIYGLRLGDTRADLLSATKILDEAAVDRYEFIRNSYFQQRNYLVYDGNPPYKEGFEDELDQEMEVSLKDSATKK